MRLKAALVIAFALASLACGAADSSPSEKPVARTTPVGVGEVAPDFTLADHRDGRVSLSSNRGAAPVVLVFYRGHW